MQAKEVWRRRSCLFHSIKKNLITGHFSITPSWKYDEGCMYQWLEVKTQQSKWIWFYIHNTVYMCVGENGLILVPELYEWILNNEFSSCNRISRSRSIFALLSRQSVSLSGNLPRKRLLPKRNCERVRRVWSRGTWVGEKIHDRFLGRFLNLSVWTKEREIFATQDS